MVVQCFVFVCVSFGRLMSRGRAHPLHRSILLWFHLRPYPWRSLGRGRGRSSYSVADVLPMEAQIC